MDKTLIAMSRSLGQQQATPKVSPYEWALVRTLPKPVGAVVKRSDTMTADQARDYARAAHAVVRQEAAKATGDARAAYAEAAYHYLYAHGAVTGEIQGTLPFAIGRLMFGDKASDRARALLAKPIPKPPVVRRAPPKPVVTLKPPGLPAPPKEKPIISTTAGLIIGLGAVLAIGLGIWALNKPVAKSA